MLGLIFTFTFIIFFILAAGWLIGDDWKADGLEALKIFSLWILWASVVYVIWALFVRWFIFSYLLGLF